MLITTTNTNTAILQNIVQTLEQLKTPGQANRAIQIDSFNPSALPLDGFEVMDDPTYEALDTFEFEELGNADAVTYTISFYVDAGRTNLLFTDTSTASPDKFTAISGRVFYTPSDTGLNDNATVSNTKSQWAYYLTATSTAGLNAQYVYDNSQNLLFKSVVVSSKANPKFTMNANQAVIHVLDEVQKMLAVSGIHGYIIASYDIYLQQIIPDWSNLSEQNRIQLQQQAANMMRNALQADRSRGGNTTLYSADLYGTSVKTYKPLASDAVLKGVVRVDCAYWTDGDSSF